jgi:hypothetical protein
MVKTVSQFMAVQKLWVVALVLTSGCAAQPPQLAATQKTTVTGDDQLTCVTEQSTGSLIPTRVCTTKAQRDRTVKDTEDAMAAANGSAAQAK